MDSRVVILPVENIGQANKRWCWLAVAEQVVRWKQGTSPSQEVLAASVMGEDRSGWERGGTLREIGEIIRVHSGAFAVAVGRGEAEEVFDWLNKGVPLVVNVQTGPEQYHVVVLRGMVWSGAPGDPLCIVNDPYVSTGYSLAMPWPQLRKAWVDALAIV